MNMSIDEQIEQVIEQAATSEIYSLRRTVGLHDYHIAFSVMGDVKRINVCEQEDGTIPDTDETRYVVERLWAGLEPEREASR